VLLLADDIVASLLELHWPGWLPLGYLLAEPLELQQPLYDFPLLNDDGSYYGLLALLACQVSSDVVLLAALEDPECGRLGKMVDIRMGEEANDVDGCLA
jgi:hypothetical protein